MEGSRKPCHSHSAFGIFAILSPKYHQTEWGPLEESLAPSLSHGYTDHFALSRQLGIYMRDALLLPLCSDFSPESQKVTPKFLARPLGEEGEH